MKLLKIIAEQKQVENSVVAIAMLTTNDLKELKNVVDHVDLEWTKSARGSINDALDFAEKTFHQSEIDNHLVTPWGFVEKFYPDYYNSKEIAYNSELTKIYNNEDENESEARRILMDDFNGDVEKATAEMHKTEWEIYRKAIQGFLNSIL